jgi:hypothetical protein
MPIRGRFLIAFILGIIGGALLMPICMTVQIRATLPDMSEESILGFVTTFGIPIGSLFGSSLSIAQVFRRLRQMRLAGEACLSAGTCVIVFVSYVAAWGDAMEICKLFAVPLCTGIVFCVYGRWLRKQK